MIELTFPKELMLKNKQIKRVKYLSLLLFLDKRFNFQRHVCNKSHSLLITSMNLSDIAILNFKSADSRCIISETGESKAINLMQNINLTEKSKTLQNIKFIITYKNG